jgi:hypothetical protein
MLGPRFEGRRNPMTSKLPSRFPGIAAGLALALAWLPLDAHALVLQIDAPWNTTGPNTGSVGATPVTASLANDSWSASFGDELTFTYDWFDLLGSLAAPPGTVGDLFGLTFGPGDTEVLTLTLGAPLADPTIILVDLDAVGASVSVSAGADVFTVNFDGQWVGDTLTVLAGEEPGFAGAWAGVRYAGMAPAGTVFTLAFDYDGPEFSVDHVLVGIHTTVVPEPGTGWLLCGAAALLAAGRGRRRRTS